MKNRFLLIVIMGVVLCSCQHDPPPPVPAPEIVINDPETGIYNNGDTVFIDADISDENELLEAFVCIRDSVDTMFSFDPDVTALSLYHVDTFWVVNGIPSLKPVFVSVTAENNMEKTAIISRAITLFP